MTNQLDPYDRYQIKKQKFLRKILRRMFRMVGRTYSPKITGQPDWFLTSTWTIEQATAFQNFFVKTAMKDLRLRKRQALKEAIWFGFFCGWKFSEGGVAPVNKAKIIPCDHRRHICRCKDFQPAKDDDFARSAVVRPPINLPRPCEGKPTRAPSARQNEETENTSWRRAAA